eukprot:CAMPEP_0115001774 /NCGR_PEP_ID=MMETSP0216-20121206/17594_1 /TAXON_ID=223996 /ORGANISM="Protocruzia adherens, Strain Boccale" /LENGTH=123 /DNA_ID=CAMNT_0002367209 /DNA_START=62 /DNA_END=433 /DNA_ORIENTATION=-
MASRFLTAHVFLLFITLSNQFVATGSHFSEADQDTDSKDPWILFCRNLSVFFLNYILLPCFFINSFFNSKSKVHHDDEKEVEDSIPVKTNASVCNVHGAFPFEKYAYSGEMTMIPSSCDEREF